MKCACPICGWPCGMFKGQCPKCGFSRSLGAVLKFYWQYLSHSLTRTTALRCPKCGFPNPLKAVSCERCHCDITVAGAATTVTEPARRRWQDFKRNASRGTMWRLQWAYLVFSVVLLWSLLSYVEKHGGKFWPFYMLLSIVYVAVLSYFALWLIPRKNFIGLFRFASRLVKLGLDVEDLLAGVDPAQWQPGGDGAVGFLGGVQVGFCGAQAGGELVVVGVGDEHGLTRWRGHRFE